MLPRACGPNVRYVALTAPVIVVAVSVLRTHYQPNIAHHSCVSATDVRLTSAACRQASVLGGSPYCTGKVMTGRILACWRKWLLQRKLSHY